VEGTLVEHHVGGVAIVVVIVVIFWIVRVNTSTPNLFLPPHRPLGSLCVSLVVIRTKTGNEKLCNFCQIEMGCCYYAVDPGPQAPTTSVSANNVQSSNCLSLLQ